MALRLRVCGCCSVKLSGFGVGVQGFVGLASRVLECRGLEAISEAILSPYLNLSKPAFYAFYIKVHNNKNLKSLNPKP